MMPVLAALLAFLLVPQTSTDEDVLRGLVRQYYDAQTNKDVDASLGFWSTAANPRMSREGFVALFGAGAAAYTVDVQSVTITGSQARELAKGVPIGAAWRAATLSAREKAGGAPAGWAGLRLIGGDRQ